MCGINSSGAHWCCYISILCCIHLKLALLHHKTVLVTFLLYSTVLGARLSKLSLRSKKVAKRKQTLIEKKAMLLLAQPKKIFVSKDADIKPLGHVATINQNHISLVSPFVQPPYHFFILDRKFFLSLNKFVIIG